MEAGSQYPPESNIFGDIFSKFTELPTEQDDAVELFPEIPIKEELIEEVMQDLYKEITCSSKCTNPSSSPSATSFVAGAGKSESCGASVSDLASTVMAGVEFVGSTERFVGVKTEIAGGSSSSTLAGAEKGFREGDQVDGCDGEEVDDEWLARVLSWGPVELDSWF